MVPETALKFYLLGVKLLSLKDLFLLLFTELQLAEKIDFFTLYFCFNLNFFNESSCSNVQVEKSDYKSDP